MTPEQRRAQAVAVRALLEDPNVQDAFATIEGDLVAEWKRTFDPAERENLWRAINVIDRLKAWMTSSASHDLTALRRAK
jgi:hypothetical protein